MFFFQILIMKAKYIILKYELREVILIKQFFNKIKLKITKSIILYIDNKMSIILIKNVKTYY